MGYAEAVAIAEYQAHSFSEFELVEDLGNHAEYEEADILEALGY